MTNTSKTFETAQKELEDTIKLTNKKIEELSLFLPELSNQLNTIHNLFDEIRNLPSENKIQYEELKKVRTNWKTKVDLIEQDFKKNSIKAAGQVASGVGVGAAVCTLAPSAAMGIATTFGVASTGTAISALSGAAATNAALAWLGGGALAAGGGGMVAGNALLALAGPVGWTIAGIALITSGIIFYNTKSEKEKIENIFKLICIRDTKSYKLATDELTMRIEVVKQTNEELKTAIANIKTFGTNYFDMTEKQQYQLGAYFNLTKSATGYLSDPILGLLPKFTEEDFVKLCKVNPSVITYKSLILALGNLLFNIELNEDTKKVLYNYFSRDDNFLASINMSKKSFEKKHLDMVEQALYYRYQLRY